MKGGLRLLLAMLCLFAIPAAAEEVPVADAETTTPAAEAPGPEAVAPGPAPTPAMPEPGAAAPEPASVPAPAVSEEPIGKPSGTSFLGSGKAGTERVTTPSTLGRNLLACTVVGLLLGAGAWLLRRSFPARLTGKPTGLMEVLGRLPVSPKHTVVLVRVAGRVLVVGISPDTMNTLSEIEQPEEVEKMLLKELAPAEGFGARLAGVLAPFRRTPIGAFGGGETPPAAGEGDALEGEIRALERRVASWRKEDPR